MTEKIALCAMRLTDMLFHQKGELERPCSKCGETVALFNSGQWVLREHGEANVVIICNRCFAPGNFDTVALAPGAREEAIEITKRKRRSARCN